MMKTGDFAAPQKEEWGGEDKVEDWAADGQPAAAGAPPVPGLLSPGTIRSFYF